MRPAALLIAALGLPAPACAVSAQSLIRLAPQGSEIGTEARSEQWGVRGRKPSRSQWLGEWVSVSLNGLLVSPRVFSWSLTLRPYLSQQGGSQASVDVSARNTGLSFGANLLAGLPVSASLYAQRSSGEMVSGQGGSSVFRSATLGGALQWRNDALPLQLSVNEHEKEDAWQSVTSAPPFLRNELLRSARLEARNSKLTLSLERIGFADRIGPLSFGSSSATAAHTLRWGHGSTLLTQVQAESRDGSFAYDRRGGGARLNIRHTPIATSTAYVDRRQGTMTDLENQQVAMGYDFRHQTSSWIANSASLAWNRSMQGSTRVATARYGSRTELQRQLARGYHLSATAGTTVERVDQDFGDDAFTHVFAEPYVVEATRGFELRHPDVDVTTIRIRSVDQTLLYVRDTDYGVFVTGSVVRIQALPGGRLQPGDALLLDYRYAVREGGRHNVVAMTGDIAVGNGWGNIWMSEATRQASSNGPERAASALGGRDRSLGLSFHRTVGLGRVAVDVLRRTRWRSVADVRSNDAHVTYTPSTIGSRRWSFGARATSSHAGGQSLISTAADASLMWNVSPGLQLLANGEHWFWRPGHAAPERYMTGTAEVNWRFGQMDLTTRYIFQRRILQVVSDQHRLLFRLVRHF